MTAGAAWVILASLQRKGLQMSTVTATIETLSGDRHVTAAYLAEIEELLNDIREGCALDFVSEFYDNNTRRYVKISYAACIPWHNVAKVTFHTLEN